MKKNSSICTKSYWGLFWAETHPLSKFPRKSVQQFLCNPDYKPTNYSTFHLSKRKCPQRHFLTGGVISKHKTLDQNKKWCPYNPTNIIWLHLIGHSRLFCPRVSNRTKFSGLFGNFLSYYNKDPAKCVSRTIFGRKLTTTLLNLS